MQASWMTSTQLGDLLQPTHGGGVPAIQLFEESDSTNAEALRQIKSRGAAGEFPPTAIIARSQTAGRGRRGRSWMSEPDAGLYLSYVRSFPCAPDALQGLSLVVGLSVLSVLSVLPALQSLPAEAPTGLSLKWPNDILYQGRKLGGILLELTLTGGNCVVVMGVGLNLKLPRGAEQALERPIADLGQVCAASRPPQVLAAQLLNRLGVDIARFESGGFAPFVERWNLADAYRGRRVSLQQVAGQTEGISRGVDSTGGLLLELPDGSLARFEGGELSGTLRLEEVAHDY